MSQCNPFAREQGRPRSAFNHCFLSLLAALLPIGMAQADTTTVEDEEPTTAVDTTDLEQMFDLDIEQLMQMDVTSVAGVAQPWFQTPAAMYVLTSEDIRRAGHTSIPEALRMVPGMFVAKNSSWLWSISARGFNGSFANKLQVLVDGREIYDPLFSGTLWEIHDIIFDDLDRIEVIRGPGATLWGANAVNGVINITSKSAKDTQGWYLSGMAGNYEKGAGELRYGGQLSDTSWFRVWGTYHDRAAFDLPEGAQASDDWDMARAGFRVDSELEDAEGDTNLTVQGNMQHSDRLGDDFSAPVPGHLTTTTYSTDSRSEGFNLQFNLNQAFQNGNGWQFKGSFTHNTHTGFGGFQLDEDIADLDFQHHFAFEDVHKLIWGVNGRYISYETEAGPTLSYTPSDKDTGRVSSFIQDTLTLVDDQLFLMAGSKFEYNDYTGFEYQPSARLWWTPDDQHTIWTSFSRAVRVTGPTDQDLLLNTAYVDTGLAAGGPASGVFVPLYHVGNPNLGPEVLFSYEAGYRERLRDNLTLDIAGFYNEYEDLVTAPPGGLSGVYRSTGHATHYGVETVIDWLVTPCWRLTASHSFLYMRWSDDLYFNNSPTPKNQFQVRSELDITDDLEFNAALYYYDKQEVIGPVPTSIDAFARLDMGITWRPTHNLELSFWGQNLLDSIHSEAPASLGTTSLGEVPMSFYGKLTYRF